MSEQQPFDRAAWLEARRSAIGASDVPAILGVSPWQSAWDIWAEKTRLIEEWKGDEATQLGQLFEPSVLAFAEKQLGPLRRNVRLLHPTIPVIASTLDAQCYGSLRPVEVKTTGLAGPICGDWGAPLTDEVPEYHLSQVLTQLTCTAVDMGYLFALLPGRGIVEYHIPYSKIACEILEDFLPRWWQRHIVEGEEPSRDKASLEIVRRMRRQPKKSVSVTEEIERAVDRFEKAKRVIKRAGEIKDKYESKMLIALGDAEEGTLPSGQSYTYFEQEKKSHFVAGSKYRVLRVRKASKK